MLRRSDQPPELVYPNGTKVDHLATGTSTNKQFGLYRWNMGPKAGGPGPHFHRTISESFFVLSGTVTLYDGRQWVGAGEGDFEGLAEFAKAGESPTDDFYPKHDNYRL